MSIHQREEVKKMLDGMLERKVIEPMQSGVMVIPSSISQKRRMDPHDFV